MARDSWYYVGTSDWPVTAIDTELTTDDILAVLDEIPQYYQGAVSSLAETVVPGKTDEFRRRPTVPEV